MKRIRMVAAASVATALSLAACGSSGDSATSPSSGSGSAKYVNGATFTYSVSYDLGTLNPYLTVLGATNTFDQFLYATLISQDAQGNPGALLAKSWTATTTTASFTLKSGITCSDGSALSASDVAADINWVAIPANKSSMLGQYVQAGTTATADDSTGTVSVTSGKPDSFLLQDLGSLPIVCKSGLNDQKLLAAGKAGTGPYVISDVTAGDHYTATLRSDYAWGPGSWKASLPGVPAKVTAKVVANATTTANLLLSGGLNYAQITGADAARVAAQKLFHVDQLAPVGEINFNEAAGHPGADLAVRTAIIQALDLDQVGKVLTNGTGKPLDQMLQGTIPNVCPGNTVKGNIPTSNVEAAKSALDQAGWTVGPDGVRSKDGKKLALTFMYFNSVDGYTPAIELIQQELAAVGVTVTLKLVDGPAFNSTTASGNWDMFMSAFQVPLPSAMVSSFSGPNFQNGGVNLTSTNNPTYDSLAAQAAKQAGKQGCSLWLQAESALIKDLDVVPFYGLPTPAYGKGATFSLAQFPWSIRMTAS